MTRLGIGVIGCGNISTAYFSFAPLFSGIEMRACADLNTEAAHAQAERFGLRAMTVDALLAADDIDIVVNLTVPDAHFAVSNSILTAVRIRIKIPGWPKHPSIICPEAPMCSKPGRRHC